MEPAKVSAKARFKEDLSLDSLDVVEVRACAVNHGVRWSSVSSVGLPSQHGVDSRPLA